MVSLKPESLFVDQINEQLRSGFCTFNSSIFIFTFSELLHEVFADAYIFLQEMLLQQFLKKTMHTLTLLMSEMMR